MTFPLTVTWPEVAGTATGLIIALLILIILTWKDKRWSGFNKIGGRHEPPYTVTLCRGIAFPEVILNRTLFNRCAHHPPFRWFHLVRFTLCKCVDNSRALVWRLWIYTRKHAIHLDATWKRGGF